MPIDLYDMIDLCTADTVFCQLQQRDIFFVSSESWFVFKRRNDKGERVEVEMLIGAIGSTPL